VAELETSPNFAELLAEYGEECAIDGIGMPDPQFETYRQLEQAGIVHLLGAWDRDELVGFLILVVTVLPHYGKKVACTESFFVSKSVRTKGFGLHLLIDAECLAKRLEAVGLLVSAPSGGVFDQMLGQFGYKQTNNIYFRPCS
jgi:GNAT superfamily N-acetyltransferase